MRILVALDSSECSTAALKCAEKFDCPIGTEIKVVTVIDLTETFPITEEVKLDASKAVNKLISAAVERLQQAHPDADVSAEVLDGYPIEAIINIARNWLADLIIVGSHGRRGFSRFWLGSVSRGILLHAPCAVRIVRTDRGSDGQGQNVLICVDQSQHSGHLVDHVLALPWRENTRFRCVHAVRPPERPGLMDEGSALEIIDDLKQMIGVQKEWLDEVAGRINKAYGQEVATAEILIGDPREKILEVALQWPADLIILGSHGKRDIERLIMGSVSEAVALNAGCSVEITRVPAFRKRGMHIIMCSVA